MSSMAGAATGRSPRLVSTLALDAAIVAAALIAMLLALRGPGTDNDIYAMVATWRYLLESGVYVPSRGTGYPVAELIVGLGAELFSWKAVGLLSVPAAVAAGYLMLRCLRCTDVHATRARLALAFVATSPAWLVAASSGMDHIWAQLFLWAGFHEIVARRPLAAAVAFALAVGCRFAFLPCCIAVLAASQAIEAIRAGGDRRRMRLGAHVAAGLTLLGLAALLYLPAIVFYGSLGTFLSSTAGSGFSLLRNVGTLAFIAVSASGLISLVAVFVVLGWKFAAVVGPVLAHPSPSVWTTSAAGPRVTLAAACSVFLVVYGAVLLRYPLAEDYWVHVVPLVGMLLVLPALPTGGRGSASTAFGRMAVVVLAIGQLSACYLSVSLFRRTDPGRRSAEWAVPIVPAVTHAQARSDGARYQIGLFLIRGRLVRDFSARGSSVAQYRNAMENSDYSSLLPELERAPTP